MNSGRAIILCKRQSLKETKCGKCEVNVQFNNGGAVKHTHLHSCIWALGAITIFSHSFCSHSTRIISSQSLEFLFSVLAQLYDHLLHHKNIYCTTYNREKIRMVAVAVFLISFCYFFSSEHICSVVCARTYENVLTEVFSLSVPMCSLFSLQNANFLFWNWKFCFVDDYFGWVGYSSMYRIQFECFFIGNAELRIS